MLRFGQLLKVELQWTNIVRFDCDADVELESTFRRDNCVQQNHPLSRIVASMLMANVTMLEVYVEYDYNLYGFDGVGPPFYWWGCM